MRYLAPDHRLSLNFRVHEFCRSETAQRHGIEIRVVEDSPVHRNLRGLAHHTLQPVRQFVGTLHVSSGYRPPHVNELVGGAPDSQHPKGEAADVWHDTLSPSQIAHAFTVGAEVVFDQLILEYDQEVVHVSHVRGGPNRREVLTRYRDSVGELRYVAGLLTERLVYHRADEARGEPS